MEADEMKIAITLRNLVYKAGLSFPKSSLKEEMQKAYEPSQVEEGWNEFWEKNNLYRANAESTKPKFVMMIPPPNVTGALHLGHALTYSIEDSLSRWHRMNGHEVLWLPGVDHAGISTQSVVEKQLWKEGKITRHDLGREAFLKKVWQWKEEYGSRICNQSKRMGVSVDWSRFAFTMDERLSRAVIEAFVRMRDKGILYRDLRLVNWCCQLRTALSDLEVEYLDLEQPVTRTVPGHTQQYEFGIIEQFAYKVKGTNEELIVATTRLETMLGDTAVAVHPNDPRYQHLIGKELEHPFCPERKMVVIGDPILVDMNFGTGAVKVTPAHDFNDFVCGARNNLQRVNVFSDDGKINQNGGKFAGMMRFDARLEIRKEMEQLGIYKGKSPNKMRIGICAKTGDIIEPILKPQWWVNCKSAAERSVKAVRTGEFKILPQAHEKTWFQWLENIKDWCISRQLWWGHRCPAYLVFVYDKNGNLRYQPESQNDKHWVVGHDMKEALERANVFKVDQSDTIKLEQDEDVLDTWFSSGIFPFSTLGWPDVNDPDYKAFYPNQILETGYDILFFWVARMVMMGYELTDQLPFHTTYLHAMVRDKEGRKMSKSLGNTIDPLEVIDGTPLSNLLEKIKSSNLDPKEKEKSIKSLQKEFPEGIPECGSDALRFGLLAYTIQGQNINLDIKRIIGYRNFCNKLWQATKFAKMNLGEEYQQPETAIQPQIFLNKWILSRLNECTKTINQRMKEYLFGDVISALYKYWMNELCDVYLEGVKPIFKKGSQSQQEETKAVLQKCFLDGLKLLHPFIPFVTEELYFRFPASGKQESISVDNYPQEDQSIVDNESQVMEAMLETASLARSLAASLEVADKKPHFYLKIKHTQKQLFVDNVEFLRHICKASKVEITETQKQGCPANVNLHAEVYLQLSSDMNVQQQIQKLTKKLQQNEKSIETTQKKMQVPNYEEKVPLEVREKTSESLKNYQDEAARIKEILNSLAQA